MLKTLTGDLRSLHDVVLAKEKDLIKSTDLNYPVFTAKVPKGWDFVDTSPADEFFLRFDHIFDMFHMKSLDDSLVHLFALHLTCRVGKEQISDIAIGEPYYMHEHHLISHEGHAIMSKYIEDFMVKNKRNKSCSCLTFPSKSFSSQHNTL
jgi:hypothetical protein